MALDGARPDLVTSDPRLVYLDLGVHADGLTSLASNPRDFVFHHLLDHSWEVLVEPF